MGNSVRGKRGIWFDSFESKALQEHPGEGDSRLSSELWISGSQSHHCAPGSGSAPLLRDVGAQGTVEGRPRTKPWEMPAFKGSGKGVPRRGRWELSRSHAGGRLREGTGEGGAREGLAVQSERFPGPSGPGCLE